MSAADDVRKRVEDVCLGLVSDGLAIDINRPLILSLPSSQRLVTWSAATSLSQTFGELGTIESYRAFLRERDFNVMLFDGSLLQFAFLFEHERLIYHRLCYFPCPIVFDQEEAALFSVEELIDACAQDWVERVRLRTPIRFDFDPNAASAVHPEVHMTINQVCCRIAVSAPLSVGHFVRFVFQHFYPDHHAKHAYLHEAVVDQYDATLASIEAEALYVLWRRTSS